MPRIPGVLGRATDRRRHRGAEPLRLSGRRDCQALVFEGVALGYQDAGILKLAKHWLVDHAWVVGLALVQHWAGLAGGPVGLAAGRLAAGLLSWDWSSQSALETCSQQPSIDHRTL